MTYVLDDGVVTILPRLGAGVPEQGHVVGASVAHHAPQAVAAGGLHGHMGRLGTGTKDTAWTQERRRGRWVGRWVGVG